MKCRAFTIFLFSLLFVSVLPLAINIRLGRAEPGVFGKTSIGLSVDSDPEGYVYACRFQTPENGTATLISAYARGRFSTGLVKAMIYSDVAGEIRSLLFESEEIVLDSSWKWHNFSVSYNLQGGTYYWFAVFADVTLQYRYDPGQPSQHAYAWRWTYPTVPTEFDAAGGPRYSDLEDSIYITYGEEGPVKNLDTGLSYQTIQAAIDAAETLDGHRIRVTSGEYNESPWVHKELILFGDGTGAAFVNGSFSVQAENVVVANFTFSHIWVDMDNCTISGNTIANSTMPHWRAGIHISWTVSHTIEKNNIVNHSRGILFYESSGGSDWTTVSENNITNCRTAIDVWGSKGANIYGNKIADNNQGIWLFPSDASSTRGFNISGNDVEGNGYGIRVDAIDLEGFIDGCSETDISLNNIDDNNVGVYSGSSYIEVYGNNITNNSYGVYLESDRDSSGIIHGSASISSNFISYNNHAIYLNHAWYNIISNNNVTINSGDGVYLYNSSDNTISGNNITDNSLGIYISGSSSNVSIAENSIKNNAGSGIIAAPEYYGEVRDLFILGNSMVNNSLTGVVLFPRSGSRCEAYISGNNITNNGGAGISIFGDDMEYCYSEADVVGNNIRNNSDGITLDGPSSAYISRNNITESGVGIHLAWLTDANITLNNIAHNDVGIYSHWFDGLYVCGNNITNNIGAGLNLLNPWKPEIIGNNITNNGGIGIYCSAAEGTIASNSISDNQVGISLYMGSSFNITANNIAFNSWSGIHVESSSSNNISDNIIAHHDVGIEILQSSFNNTIYHNDLIDNQSPQVMDQNASSNHWHHPGLLEGNYWSNYSGVDDGSGTGKHAIADDGIGDTLIPHPGPDYDYYPLMNPRRWQPTATLISITPKSVEILAGETTEVTVEIANVVKLYAWQMRLYFNSTVVNVTDVQLPVGHVFDGQSIVDAGPVWGSDYIQFGVSLLGSGWTFNGSGVLCTIQLQGLTPGNSTLTFDLVDTFLQNSTTIIPSDKDGGLITVTPSHNIAVTDATTICKVFPEYETWKTVVCQNYTVTFNVTVKNIGNSDETNIIVRAFADGTEFANQTIPLLSTGSNETLSFTWNTTGWQKGNYTISFNATIPTDADPSNNYLNLSWPIAVTMIGDVDDDGDVDMADIAFIAAAFGAEVEEDGYLHPLACKTCPHNSNLDINDDGKIDMRDLIIAAVHFGETDP